MGVARAAVGCMQSTRYVVILAWLVVTVLGAVYGPRFTQNTFIDFSVPEASEGYEAAEEFAELFQVDDTPVTALVTMPDGGPVLGEDLRALTKLIVSWSAEVGIEEGKVSGYYTFLDAGLPELAAPFVNNPGHPNISNASLVLVALPVNASANLSQMLLSTLHESAPASLEVAVAGEPYFLQAALDGVTHDIEQVHPKVVPFAVIPFLYIVRSWRLCLVTLACIAATAGASFFVMYFVSNSVAVANFAPSMMLSAVIATSIDYSLFLLSRFREEVQSTPSSSGPADVARALTTCLVFAGHTVLTSGTTLAICFFGLMFFPVGLISSLGLATGITISISIVVNLTLLPSLILAFPRFFSSTGCGCSRAAAAQRERELTRAAELRNAAQAEGDFGAPRGGEGPRAALVRKEAGQSTLLPRGGRRRTCWALVSGLSMRCGWVVVAVFLGAMVPCAVEVGSIQTSMRQEEMMPRDADASLAYAALVDAFGSGTLFPFRVLLKPGDGGPPVESADFFDKSRTLVRRALNLTGAAGHVNVTGVMLADAQDLPFDLVHRALHAGEAECAILTRLFKRPVCEEVRLAWERFTDADLAAGRNASATYVTVALGFDAFGPAGTRWISDMRAALAQAQAEGGGAVAAGLSGGSTAMVDSVRLVYSYFPLMVGATLGVVFTLLGLAFRSVVVPVRAVLTISLSLVMTVGCAWLVYGRGALDSLGWPPLGKSGALVWSSPVLSFPIMVGLGLDYDIFLLGRVLEYRLAGYTDRESVASGVEHSGPLISAAGVIMAIAFGALLFSSSTSLNELAFLLTVSVLVDTFLVRTVLVPSVMGLLGAKNWWPRKMPPPTPPVDLLPLPPPTARPPDAAGSAVDSSPAGSPADGPPEYDESAAAVDANVASVFAARFTDHGDLGEDNEPQVADNAQVLDEDPAFADGGALDTEAPPALPSSGGEAAGTRAVSAAESGPSLSPSRGKPTSDANGIAHPAAGSGGAVSAAADGDE